MLVELPDQGVKLFFQCLGFAMFPKLPIELRWKIMEYTNPRCRRLVCKVCPFGDNYRISEIFISPGVPVALRVNSESRFEALKQYEAFEEDKLKMVECACYTPRKKFYFSRVLDFFYIQNVETTGLEDYLFRYV